MAAYKEPTFDERVALAQKSREKALQKLAARPQMDEAEIVRRRAAAEAREAAAAEKRAARNSALAQAKADKAAKAEAAAAVAAIPVPTEEDLKAARDAKYAARKARKK